MNIKKMRLRSTEVEVVLYEGYNEHGIALWSKRKVIVSPVLEPTADNPRGCYLQVKTSTDGILTAIPGEYLIKNADGKVYPMTLNKLDLLYGGYHG